MFTAQVKEILGQINPLYAAYEEKIPPRRRSRYGPEAAQLQWIADPGFSGIDSRRNLNPPDWPTIDIKAILRLNRELNQSAVRLIGKNGLDRFRLFRQFPEGWDSGTGTPLLEQSVKAFELFAAQFSKQMKNEPSLFLTRSGHLQLGWEDKAGQTIELEFYPDNIEYFIEALDDEGAISLDDISALIDKLSPLVE